MAAAVTSPLNAGYTSTTVLATAVPVDAVIVFLFITLFTASVRAFNFSVV